MSDFSEIDATVAMKRDLRAKKAAHVRPAGALTFESRLPSTTWSGNVMVTNSQDIVDAKFVVEFTPDDATKMPICDIGIDASLGHTGLPYFADDYDCFTVFPLPPVGNHPKWQINFTHNDASGSFPNQSQNINNLLVVIFTQIFGTVTIVRVA